MNFEIIKPSVEFSDFVKFAEAVAQFKTKEMEEVLADSLMLFNKPPIIYKGDDQI